MNWERASAVAAAHARVEDRSAFLVRTYLHLAGAVVAFVALEAALFATGVAQAIARFALGTGFSWLILLAGFIGISYLADRWARRGTSVGMQYAGLGAYIVGEAIIFAPLLVIAVYKGGDGVLGTAALTTLILFVGLTGIVFITRKDFSFLRGVLMLGGFAALGLIVVSVIIGFSLGTFFAWAMIALAAGYILYNTSNVLHHYRTDQHVAAALSLFAAVALMFYYVLTLLLSRD